MLPNIAKLQPMLERMTGPQLQQFAAMHHDDAVAVGLAMQIDKNRKKEVARLQGLMSGQKQPTVIDQAMQALGGQQPPMQGGPQGGAPMPPPGGPQGQMPPQGMPPQGPPGMQMPPQAPPAPQGVAALPAPNMEGMADGGIAGYADEDEAVGYADGGVVHMAAGTPESMFDNVSEEDMRARGRAYGISEDAIDRFIQNRKGAASASQRQLPSAPVTTGVVGAPKVTSTPLTGSELWAGQEPMFDFIKRGIGNLLPGGERKEYDIAANRAQELPLVEAAVQQQRDIRRPTRNIAAPSAEEYAATTPPPSAPPPPAAAPTEPARTFADVYRSLGGDQRLTAGAKTGIGTGARKVTTPSIAGIDSLIPEKATEGITPEAAMEKAGKFSLGNMYTEGQELINRAGERQDRKLRELFKTRPTEEVGKKAEEYIKS